MADDIFLPCRPGVGEGFNIQVLPFPFGRVGLSTTYFKMAPGDRAAGLIVFRCLQGSRAGIQYLLLQTSYGRHHWTPPKGHVDPGESDLQTAVRETEEESGLHADSLEILENIKKVIMYPVKGKPKTVIYWPARLKESNIPVVLSDEHQRFEWLDLQGACKLLHDTTAELLREVDKELVQKLG